MKKIYILSIVLVSLAACTSKTKKKEDKLKKEVLFGTLNDGLYVNPFFNLSIDFDENWNVDTKSIKSISFGGDLLSANYVDSYDEYYPITLTMTADKANPFGSKSPVEQLKESQEGYEFLFNKNEMIVSPFDKVSIAGEEFAHGFFQLIDESDTSFVHEYYRFKDGYFLSIICVYNTPEDEGIAADIIKSIQRNK